MMRVAGLVLASLMVLAACGPQAPKGEPTTRDLREAIGRVETSFSFLETAVRTTGIDIADVSAFRELMADECRQSREDADVFTCSFSLIIYDPTEGTDAPGVLATGEGQFRRGQYGWQQLQSEYQLVPKARAVAAE